MGRFETRDRGTAGKGRADHNSRSKKRGEMERVFIDVGLPICTSKS